MKKIKDFILLVKTELAICVAIPVITAVLLGSGVTGSGNYFPMIVAGLFCVFAYGIVKMFFRLKKHEMILGAESVNKPKSSNYRIFVVISAIILPLVGLILNNNFFGPGGGVFGDFTSPWFFILAVCNGLIMLADIKNNKPGLLLFYLKIIGFTYIVYFTIIFIPFLPYGFIGVIFYGLGLLIFVPAVVFAVELFQIMRDIRVLEGNFKGPVIAAVVLGVLTIPMALTVNFTIDKVNFNNALTYLSADSWKKPSVSIPRIDRSLSHISNVLETRNSGIFSGSGIPVISKFYQTVALDNKILSSDTTERLSEIFLGERSGSGWQSASGTGAFQTVSLADFSTATEQGEEPGVYKTWVNLELKNDSDSSFIEYRTEFALPDGCFISDYYLNIGSEKKQGILADKRAALITYESIIRTPKDPGIMYYKNDGVIELKVYPFMEHEVRETGFLVMHSQNEIINIDGAEIQLTAESSFDEPLEMRGVSYIPAAYKANLKQLDREGNYYFIIDASEGSPYDEHLKRAREYIKKEKITGAKIYAASYMVWDTGKDSGKREGGFNLPLAMEMAFKDVKENGISDFPIIIAVSDKIYKAPAFLKSGAAKQFPESGYYYNLDISLSLTPYSFSDNARQNIVKAPVLMKALDYNGFALSDNGKSEVVTTGDFGDYTDDEYKNAFILHGKSVAYADDAVGQIELIKDSFRQRVLTRYTAFTVLETAEQERALLELQAKFLNGGAANAPAVMMDEPGLWICFLTGIAVIFFRRKNLCGK